MVVENEAKQEIGGQADAINNIEVMAAAQVKIPPFWSERPELWFAQVESTFALYQIRTDNAKFNHVVGRLEGKVLQYVSDAVINPPAEEKYSNLKAQLIGCFAESGQKKISKLLSDMPLGDQKPSNLLNRQRELAGTTVNEEFLKTLWIRQLPVNVQAILAVSPGDLATLAPLADKVMELTPSQNVNAATSTSSSNTSLETKVEQLTKQVNQLLRSRNFRRRSTSRSGDRSITPSRNNKNFEICWYHFKFGDKATKCRSPCKLSKNQ